MNSIEILSYIPFGHENAVKRGELVRQTGIPDREVRRLIERAQFNGEIIINLQDGKGYFQPILPEEEPLLRKWYYAEKGRHYSSAIKLNHAARLMEV